MGGVFDALIARYKASAYSVLSRVVAYVSAVVALVFILAGAFIWIAREESLVFACFVFAAAFVIIGLVGLLGAILFRRKANQIEISKANVGMSVLKNPVMTAIGLRLIGTMRRAPKTTLGLALLAGLLLSLINQRETSEQSEQA